MKVKKGVAVLTVFLVLFALTSCGKEDILGLFEMKSGKNISEQNTDHQEEQEFTVTEENNISLEETSLPDENTTGYEQAENDGHSKEKAIELFDGYTFQYEISALDEEVWMRFDPTQRTGTTYLIEVNNVDFKSNLDVNAYENSRQLEYFSLTNGKTSSLEILPDSSSPYYIHIKDGRKDSRTVGKFSVSIIKIEHTAGLKESDAPSIQAGYEYSLTKNSKYDDYFALNVTESGELHFKLTNESIDGNVGLSVIDEKGKSVIYINSETEKTSEKSVNVYSEEKFYIKVSSFNETCNGNYTFSVFYN